MSARGTAIVTGASSGIGRATAVRLARRGYRVVAIARRESRLASLVEEVGGAAVALPLDCGDVEAVERAMAEVVREQPPVEVVVHAAGHGVLTPFEQQSGATLQAMLNVHYLAAATMVRAVLPGMLERGRGHIIGVSSIATRVSPWGHGGYTAAKSALTAMLLTLHAEYGHRGVHFTSVHPGVVKTEFFDDPAYAAMPRSVLKHAIPADRVAAAIERALDRPVLQLTVPRLHGIVGWIGLLCPRLLHGRIARSSAPAGQ